MQRAWCLSLLLVAGCAAPQPLMASRDAGLLAPAPNAQGRILKSDVPSDLAIEGDAFFVLSRVVRPETVDDLAFTRNGLFKWEFTPGPVSGQGVLTLQSSDGWYVMGYETAVDGVNRPFGTAPEESISTLTTVVANGLNPPETVHPGAIQVDMVQNPDAANNLTFDPQGMLRVAGDAPRDDQGRLSNMHVMLASFPFAQYLKEIRYGLYSYSSTAGRMRLGTAANEAPSREIGKHNLLIPGALERR